MRKTNKVLRNLSHTPTLHWHFRKWDEKDASRANRKMPRFHRLPQRELDQIQWQKPLKYRRRRLNSCQKHGKTLSI